MSKLLCAVNVYPSKQLIAAVSFLPFALLASPQTKLLLFFRCSSLGPAGFAFIFLRMILRRNSVLNNQLKAHCSLSIL